MARKEEGARPFLLKAQYLAVPAINFFGLPGYQQAEKESRRKGLNKRIGFPEKSL